MHYILHKKLNRWNKKNLLHFSKLKTSQVKNLLFFGTVWIWPWNPLTNGVHLIIFQRNYCTPHLESTIFVALFRSRKNYNNNGILFRKLFWPSVRKKKSYSDQDKLLQMRGWRPRSYELFGVTGTIYLNSEWSEQFLKTEYLLFKLVSGGFYIGKLKCNK